MIESHSLKRSLNLIFSCQYEMPEVPFTADRKDCTTSPNNEQGVLDPLPDASNTSTAQFWKYFTDNFGFDRRETLALMGAHAFGQTFKVNSYYPITIHTFSKTNHYLG